MKILQNVLLCTYNKTNYSNSIDAAKESALYQLCNYELDVTHFNAGAILDMIEVAENAFKCVGNPEDFEIVFCKKDGGDEIPARDFAYAIL